MDLFPEVDRRMEIYDTYQAWRERRPWRWLPRIVAPLIFRHLFVRRELRRRYG